ncbi:hypothetical protein QDY65_05520 [Pyrococcus kukulkanii]|uniref:hypothetical protein n=1 Tax=Pyrococcus kukulkanii TaxID=1609559 RepID=UPI003569FD4E
MFVRLLTPSRSVIYILCLQALSSIGIYFVTRYANLMVVIGVFLLIYPLLFSFESLAL